MRTQGSARADRPMCTHYSLRFAAMSADQKRLDRLELKAQMLQAAADREVAAAGSQAEMAAVANCTVCHRTKANCKAKGQCKQNRCTTLKTCPCKYLKFQERHHKPEFKANKAQVQADLMREVKRFWSIPLIARRCRFRI